MYYKAKEKALNNGHTFHLAAILYRGKHIVRIGTNSNKTHPRFTRVYHGGSCNSDMHAEMDVLRFAKPGDKIYVLRFSCKGELTMAKPCEHCQEFIAETGIEKVFYSDWNGEIVEMSDLIEEGE